MKKKAFVTLFNSNYLSRGLVMYDSLARNMKDFTLYIIAFDDKAYFKLRSLKLKNVVVIQLAKFEDGELLRVKNERTSGEYCWTCSSKSLLYVLETFHEEECTYVDADLLFFNDPSCLIEELDNGDSVLITEHRYSDYCDQSKMSGKYCVQFVTVKNNESGLKVLKWWCDRCIEWCYNRIEDGKFGDQMYLDKFGELFTGVHDLENQGGGVAPWNVDQYTFVKENGRVYMKRKGDDKNIPLIFYHFHGMSFFDKDVVQLSHDTYRIPDTAITNIYKEYVRHMEEVLDKYGLHEERACWINEQKFRDNDLDSLVHEKLYYQYSLFL
jgi:hypothetical protein